MFCEYILVKCVMMRTKRWVSFLAATLAALVAVASPITGFVATSNTAHFSRSKIRFQSTSEKVEEEDSLEDCFADATILEFSLKEHKPLGITIEESLAHPMEKHVFVTKVC